MQQEIREEQFAKDTLERYSGCAVGDFRSNLLLTNFPRYVDYFAEKPEYLHPCDAAASRFPETADRRADVENALLSCVADRARDGRDASPVKRADISPFET